MNSMIDFFFFTIFQLRNVEFNWSFKSPWKMAIFEQGNVHKELLLSDVPLHCGMYPSGKVGISQHNATPKFPQSDHTVSKLSAEAGSLWNTAKQASRPQVTLKTQPPICLDYRARNRPAQLITTTYGMTDDSLRISRLSKNVLQLSTACTYYYRIKEGATG